MRGHSSSMNLDFASAILVRKGWLRILDAWTFVKHEFRFCFFRYQMPHRGTRRFCFRPRQPCHPKPWVSFPKKSILLLNRGRQSSSKMHGEMVPGGLVALKYQCDGISIHHFSCMFSNHQNAGTNSSSRSHFLKHACWIEMQRTLTENMRECRRREYVYRLPKGPKLRWVPWAACIHTCQAAVYLSVFSSRTPGMWSCCLGHSPRSILRDSTWVSVDCLPNIAKDGISQTNYFSEKPMYINTWLIMERGQIKTRWGTCHMCTKPRIPTGLANSWPHHVWFVLQPATLLRFVAGHLPWFYSVHIFTQRQLRRASHPCHSC